MGDNSFSVGSDFIKCVVPVTWSAIFIYFYIFTFPVTDREASVRVTEKI